MFDESTIFVVDNNIMFTDLKDEIVLFSNKNQFYYSLNTVGGDVFHLILKELEFSEIVEKMYKSFKGEVSKEELRSDISEIIEDLIGEGIVKKK
ncbi:PqqD family protein [bacterium]|nr:PqqD family protein [bacterium]